MDIDLTRIGVYKITNLINNKVYIGSTVRSFKKRFNEHLKSLRKGIHKNNYLQASYNKYGEEKFSWEIVEICSKDTCESREQFHTNIFNSYNRNNGYNIRKIVNSNIGIKRSIETCIKIGLSKKGQIAWNKGLPIMQHVKESLTKANTGRIKSKEEKEKISKSTKGKILSQNTKNKISKAHKGRIHTKEAKLNMRLNSTIPILQFDKSMNLIKRYECASFAAKELKINRTSISACINNKQKFAGNFIWIKDKK